MTTKTLKARSAALLIFALLSGAAPDAAAQGGRKNTRRVQFPRGRTTVVLKGVLRGKADYTYVLRARSGQTLTAHLSVENDCCAALLVKGPDGLSLRNADGTDAGNDFSIPLTQTGDYRITVFPPDTADRKDIARYTLEVSVR
ncbi:MAG TPA: hypothetical protein VD861_00900 [Pyrinomonadaceae bacterium]|nr:hypothetical protein [Pyrinomonadaceae bacterium]